MKDIFVMLNNNIRELFKETSTWLSIIIIVQILTIWLIIYVYLDISDAQYHFYMNTKRSLECIHGVQLDSYDGNLQKGLSTEDKLIRHQNRRWHLKYIFK